MKMMNKDRIKSIDWPQPGEAAHPNTLLRTSTLKVNEKMSNLGNIT